jgi:hypothetical protein
MRRTVLKNALALMVVMLLKTFCNLFQRSRSRAATNDNNHQICNASCPIGETADCKKDMSNASPSLMRVFAG